MNDNEGLQRIEKALAGLGSEHVPREGWESRVLDQIRSSPNVPSRPPFIARMHWLRRAAAVAAAAAGLMIVWRVMQRPEPKAFTASVAYESGQLDPTRAPSEAPQLGGLAKVTVTGGEHRAVWIYHHDELKFSCPDELRLGGATCSAADDDTLTATIPLALPGNYKILMLADDKPLPKPTGTYDSDRAAADKAGAKIKSEAFW